MKSSTLKPGTLCLLTHVGGVVSWAGNVPLDGLNGRVVEVVRGPREEWGDGPGPFYDIRAPWICERFPGRNLIAIREQLIPITPSNDARRNAKRRRKPKPVAKARSSEARELPAVSGGERSVTSAELLPRPWLGEPFAYYLRRVSQAHGVHPDVASQPAAERFRAEGEAFARFMARTTIAACR